MSKHLWQQSQGQDPGLFPPVKCKEEQAQPMNSAYPVWQNPQEKSPWEDSLSPDRLWVRALYPRHAMETPEPPIQSRSTP